MDRKLDGASMHIILAVDGSDYSWAAVDLLRELPLAPPTGVFDINRESAGRQPVSIAVVAVMAPREASLYSARMDVLEKAQDLLDEKGFQVTTELLVGRPSEMLVEYARANRPDLFVLGAKGLRASFEILLGGVAQNLVEYAEWPVLVVRAPFTGIKRVLAAVDGSPYSRCALDALARFPLPEGTWTGIIHVLPPLLPPGIAAPHFPPIPEAYAAATAGNLNLQQREAEEEKEGMKMLSDFSEILKQVGMEPELVLRRGDEASEIINYAKLTSVDLLVTGSRGLNPLRSVLLGSVSRKLVHYSGCSTLVVKGEGS
jgi:nucleotide-binding universal stress UspA family protein